MVRNATSSQRNTATRRASEPTRTSTAVALSVSSMGTAGRVRPTRAFSTAARTSSASDGGRSTPVADRIRMLAGSAGDAASGSLPSASDIVNARRLKADHDAIIHLSDDWTLARSCGEKLPSIFPQQSLCRLM